VFFKGIINFVGLLRTLPGRIVVTDQPIMKHRCGRYRVLVLDARTEGPGP
jgi:hypothetical protein